MSDTEVNEDQNAQLFFLLWKKRGDEEAAKQMLSRSLKTAEGATAVTVVRPRSAVAQGTKREDEDAAKLQKQQQSRYSTTAEGDTAVTRASRLGAAGA
jgi:hypothetical protein